LEIDTNEFIYTDISLYGYDFRIGTAHKHAFVQEASFTYALYAWYITFSVFILLLTWQLGRYKSLSVNLRSAKDRILKSQEQIESMNRELRKSIDSKNKFFSIIGHDLRQPLHSIQSLMEILNNQKQSDPKVTKIINMMTEAARSSLELINDLLKWSLSQAGKTEFTPRRIQLNELIFEVVESMKSQAEVKQVEVEFEQSNSLPFSGDGNMISTVIRNLLSNAIKYTQKFGKVTLRTFIVEHEICIEIADNGIGMNEAERLSLFKISGHTRQRGTSNEPESGLGLLLTADFISKHGGRIEVDSEAGKGSTFRVFLPNNAG
jgi:two-component system, sensor histidine kinase and response regulator